MSNEFKVEAPPLYTNYRIDMRTIVESVPGNWQAWPVIKGSITCTTCDGEVVNLSGIDFNPTVAEYTDWVQRKVAKHNTYKHPELLYLLTPHGWFQASVLGISSPLNLLHD